MIIPREFLQRLRDTVPLSELINKRVPLRRKGREWEACCPFHQEKTPSFTVNDAKGFYHCFGCGAHGDSLKFLMDFERLPYMEAVEALAREAGLAVPKPTPEQARRERQRQSLEDVLEQATLWFSQQLQLAGGHTARDYLHRRGLPTSLQQHFRLGYAPDTRTSLKDALLKQGITEQQMLAAGLIISPDAYHPAEQGRSAGSAASKTYDRFRGRVMFPILNGQGQVIAFGGRLLAKDEKVAKYLNSPETELFHKGQVLYNWRNARAAADDKNPLLVAEGYMDVIALHQHGFPQAVAPLGTALTEHHLQKLWQASDAPILCLDGDAAGQRAMWRAAELALPLLQPGKTLQFCTLPAGEDPDDFLRRHGAEAFRKLLKSARPLSQVMVAHIRAETGEDTPEKMASLEKKLEQLAQRIAHPSLQQHFRRYFRQQLWPGKKQPKQAATAVRQSAFTDAAQSGRRSAEILVLKTLLCHPQLLQDPAVEEALSAIECRDRLCAFVQGWLLTHLSHFPDCEWPSQATSLRDAAAHPYITKEPYPEKLWETALEALHMVQMAEEIEHIKQELTSDWSEERQAQMQELQREIAELQARRYA